MMEKKNQAIEISSIIHLHVNKFYVWTLWAINNWPIPKKVEVIIF